MLDVGSGSGEDMRYFNREGFFTIGCDISLDAIAYCRERGFSVQYGNIEKLEEFYDEEQFDAVWCSHVLEHIEDWQNALDQLWHVSKSAIGICIPYDNMRDASHVRPYKKEEMEEVKQYLLNKGAKEVFAQPVNDSYYIPTSYIIVALK